jgi:hypothetical protein
MKRYAAITAFLALGVLACEQTVPPAPVTCTPAAVQPASSVTVDVPVVAAARFKAVDASKISEVQANGLFVDNTLNLAEGNIIASNCNDGLLRKISKAPTTSSSGIRPQDFSKVYIETESAPLEDIITSGDVSGDYGELNFAQAQGMQLQSGVKVQAITGELKIAKSFSAGPATVSLDGALVSKLLPKFRIKIVAGKVEVFEVGLAGSLEVNLQGKIQGTLGAALSNEAAIAQFEFKRAFFLGAVPVVMVVTPRLLVGYNVGGSGTVTVTAKATPKLNMGYSLKYDKATPNKWFPIKTPPALTLEPEFNYAAQVQGSASVYAKLVIGVKFYGIAGPELTAESKVSLNLNPTGAKLTFGSSAKGSLAAGFKVLGLDLNTSLPDVSMFNATQGFNCALNGTCNPLP